MAFYVTPPGGNISLQKLTQFAETRFNFLCKILETKGDRLSLYDVVRETDTVYESDCLIEGSAKDRVSHFILRMVCCGNKEMSEFLVTVETLLFDFRFSCMNEEELYKLFKSLDSHIRKYLSYQNGLNIYIPFQTILHTFSQIKGSHAMWRSVVKKYLSGDEECFQVPFQTVLTFVSKRQVTINKGIANVQWCRLRDVVTSLFNEMLHHGIMDARSHFSTDDDRISRLIKTIQLMYRRRYKNERPISAVPFSLAHTDVDNAVSYFPPCMSHVHKALRRNHRLRHHSRIQYTLFLKEAGVPVHEALMFWKKEYSLLPGNHASCTHDWSHDERKYTYSIRHLYGLEGSRRNYRGHSCTALQENYYGPHEEGGCPFSHFDRKHLTALMEAEGIHRNYDQILQLSATGKFSRACSKFCDEKNQGMMGLREDPPLGACWSRRDEDTLSVPHHQDNCTSESPSDADFVSPFSDDYLNGAHALKMFTENNASVSSLIVNSSCSEEGKDRVDHCVVNNRQSKEEDYLKMSEALCKHSLAVRDETCHSCGNDHHTYDYKLSSSAHQGTHHLKENTRNTKYLFEMDNGIRQSLDCDARHHDDSKQPVKEEWGLNQIDNEVTQCRSRNKRQATISLKSPKDVKFVKKSDCFIDRCCLSGKKDNQEIPEMEISEQLMEVEDLDSSKKKKIEKHDCNSYVVNEMRRGTTRCSCQHVCDAGDQKQSGNVNLVASQADSICFSKPVDVYMSYKNLLNGLQHGIT